MRCYSLVDLKSGRVANREDFPLVEARVREILLPLSNSLEWALLYGSYLYDHHTPASDLDIAICCKEKITTEFLEAIQKLRNFSARYNISVEPAYTTLADLRTGSRRFESGFLSCLQKAAMDGGLIVGTKIAFLDLERAYDEARTYVGLKLNKAFNMLTLPDCLRIEELWYGEWLSDILSVWKHVARRVVEVRGCRNKAGDNLRDVFSSVVINQEIMTYYRRLEQTRSLYLGALNRYPDTSDSLWNATLAEVEEAGIVFFDFCQLVLEELCQFPP